MPVMKRPKSVALSDLAGDQKRQAWIHIKDNHPNLAGLLEEIRTDCVLQELIALTSATISINESYLPKDFSKK